MPRGSKPGERRGGRAKGTPNKATADVRAVIAAFAEANAPLMTEKLNAIEDPARWMDAYLRAIEYHIPKLARSEVTGPEGGPMKFVFMIEEKK